MPGLQPRDARSKELIQGQMNVPDVVVTRHLARDSSRVIYKFPLSFEIHATRSGVAFVGQSPNFDPKSTNRVAQVIRWARRIAQDLAKGFGPTPQDELEHRLKLRVRRRESEGRWRAWYEGKYDQGVERDTQAEAIASLRSIYLQLNEKH